MAKIEHWLGSSHFHGHQLSSAGDSLQQNGSGIERTQWNIWEALAAFYGGQRHGNKLSDKEKGEMADELFLEMSLFIQHAA